MAEESWGEWFEHGVENVGAGVSNVGSSILNNPIADVQVVVGGVLIATGVGSAAGIGLVARGGVELAAGTLSEAAKDSAQVATPQAQKLADQRAAKSAADKAKAATPAAAAAAKKKVVEKITQAPAKPVVRLTLVEEFVLGLRELFGGH